MKTNPASRYRAALGTQLTLAFLSAAALVAPAGHGFAQAAPELLTAEERAWLGTHGPLRYSTHPAAPPFGFVKPDGELDGITRELMASVGRNLGVEVKPVLRSTWTDTLAGIRRGEFDLLVATARTPERE